MRRAERVLLHVNLLLMAFAGAALATAARLAWDPTAYVAARELFPHEYRAACAALPALALALLLLAHGALFALRCRRAVRRALLLLQYASAMLAVVWGEATLSAWAAWRAARWLRGRQAEELRRHAAALREHLQPLLEHLAQYHPLSERVGRLVREARADLPRNLHALLAAAALLAALQLLAAALALLAARRRPVGSATHSTPLGSRRTDDAEAPLRAVYKDGRLVLQSQSPVLQSQSPVLQ